MSKNEDILNKLFIQECYALIAKTLHQVNFCYSIVKGAVLSKQIYGNAIQRKSSDIDILVPRVYLPSLIKIFKDQGFISIQKSREERILMLSNSHQVAPLVKEMPLWGSITIDVNFDVFWGEYEGKRINMEEFLFDTIEMDIYGARIKTLPPIKALIQLILHHYKDMNSIFLLATRKSIRYDMFKDVYCLIKNNIDAINLEDLYSISKEYEIIPYVFYVLYYTEQIFNDKILKKYVEAFRTAKGELLLNHYGLCSKEQKEWRYDFKVRLESENLYDLIKDDLTKNDKDKIVINKRVFLGVAE